MKFLIFIINGHRKTAFLQLHKFLFTTAQFFYNCTIYAQLRTKKPCQFAQKCATGQSVISRQPTVFYRSSQQSLKISPKYSHCLKNYSFYIILFRISKITPKKCQSQKRSICSTSLGLNSISQRQNVRSTVHTNLMSFVNRVHWIWVWIWTVSRQDPKRGHHTDEHRNV